jgi:hypothetical protein
MKQIFVNKLNYKKFIISNKNLFAIKALKILFYIHLSAGFFLSSFLAEKHYLSKSLSAFFWILILTLIVSAIFALKNNFKKEF